MYEATHDARFEQKLDSERNSLPPEQQLMYSITCLASALRFSVTRDEILTAAGDVSNTGLYALNRLTARALLTQRTTAYLARHRVIAEVITDTLRNRGELFVPYLGLTRTMTARYTPARFRTREAKMVRALIDHRRIARNFAIGDARTIYNDIEEFCNDDYHFWLQRGSLEVQDGNLTHARAYLLSAKDGGDHDHRVQTEWAYYLLKDAWKHPRRPDAEQQVAEAQQILLARLDHDGGDVHAWHIYGSQMLAWLRRSPAPPDTVASALEMVMRRLDDGVRTNPDDRDLKSLHLEIQNEWLGMAVPKPR
jgi:hypothetical protein